MTDKTPRSARQAAASRINGAQGRGPSSAAGKARSARNAATHGLTGKLAPTCDELDEAQRLLAALRTCFAGDDPHSAALINRVLTATLRLNRARVLITTALEDIADPTNPRRAAEQASYRQGLVTGSAPRGRAQMARYLAENTAKDSLRVAAMNTPNHSAISKLMRYAQRFRGERDRALARLAAIHKRKLR